MILIFSSKLCGPCKNLKDDINLNLDSIDDKIICYIDFNAREDLVKEFNVKNVPDIRLYQKKKEIKKKIGYRNYKEFIEWLKNN
jgi:thioredoxin-related protein